MNRGGITRSRYTRMRNYNRIVPAHRQGGEGGKIKGKDHPKIGKTSKKKPTAVIQLNPNQTRQHQRKTFFN